MKTALNTAIFIMIFLIGCNIEANSIIKPSLIDYLQTIALLPFLVLAIYARLHFLEFKEFLTKYQ